MEDVYVSLAQEEEATRISFSSRSSCCVHKMGLQWSLQPLHVAMVKNRSTVSMKCVSQFKLDAVLIVSDANCVKIGVSIL